jgi:hypothetical protein
MMLDHPGVVVAELVGQFELRQRVLEELVFAVCSPGAGQLQLVENTELHCSGPPVTLPAADRPIIRLV